MVGESLVITEDEHRNVYSVLKQWEDYLKNPSLENAPKEFKEEDLAEDIKPMVLMLRKLLEDNNIDPATIYPVDVGFSPLTDCETFNFTITLSYNAFNTGKEV